MRRYIRCRFPEWRTGSGAEKRLARPLIAEMGLTVIPEVQRLLDLATDAIDRSEWRQRLSCRKK